MKNAAAGAAVHILNLTPVVNVDGINGKRIITIMLNRFVIGMCWIILPAVVARCQEKPLKGGQIYSSNFQIDQIERDFFYYLPAQFGAKDTYPVVLFLHNAHQTARQVIGRWGDGIEAFADSNNCIVVYPLAVGEAWRAGQNRDSVNDVGFLSILINYFEQVYSANPKQVFIAGWGNGGKMAGRLACDMPGKVTAIAPFSVSKDSVPSCVTEHHTGVFPGASEMNGTVADIRAALGYFIP